MKKIGYFILLVVLSVNLIFTYNITKKPSINYLKSVTVRIVTVQNNEIKTFGTGTIVKITNDFTYILTNKHVAPINARYVYIERNNKEYPVKVLKNSVLRDLSLIRLNGKIPNTKAVKGFKDVKNQQKVFTLGMYLGLYNIYAEGNVAGWWEISRLMNMPCLNGCSGSGIFDKDGYMVAVVFAVAKYNLFGFDTAKAICVPYIGIKVFLEEIL